MSVHSTHCCEKHGCKYSDPDCTVVLGTESGIYCEDCSELEAILASYTPNGHMSIIREHIRYLSRQQVADLVDDLLDYQATPPDP